MWWLDNKMYNDTTRAWYGTALTFPYTLIYPNLRRRQVKSYITHLKNCEDVDSTLLEAKVGLEMCDIDFQKSSHLNNVDAN